MNSISKSERVKINKEADIKKAYFIMREYSTDSMHYLSLKEDNTFYFGIEVKGFISFILVGKNAMSLGDPVCKDEDLEQMVKEYIIYCESNKWKPIFTSVSYNLAMILQEKKYKVIKYGEEAILKPMEYALAGGKRASLRHNVNKVKKNGISLREYRPQLERDYILEKKIAELSERWYDEKKYKMNYSIGEVEFEEPFDRRFFVTMDEQGNLQTFLSFLPYEGERKYCIDIMHRKIDSITGVMEHAIISVMETMRDEGVTELSLGIAPLSGIDVNAPGTGKVERLLNSIFYNMDADYNFLSLYRFKNKFLPNEWKARYLAYHKDISLVKLALSITNTKRGGVDIILYLRYKFFLMGDTLGFHRINNKSVY